MRLIVSLTALLWVCSGPYVSGQKINPAYRIAYNVKDTIGEDNYEVFIMNSDGGSARNMLNHKDVAWTYYAWKDRIYFISDRDTCKRCYFLYSMDTDGNNIRKVCDLQLEDSWMGCRNDGQELIVSGRSGKSRFQLYQVNSETGRYKMLTTDTSAMYRDPSFSPDGNLIVYAYKAKRLDRSMHEELFIMNTDGTWPRQLTYYPIDDTLVTSSGYKAGPPRWNGKLNIITYNSMQGGKSSLFAITPDGRRQWKLTKNNLNEGWHDWSPDGHWLVFDGNVPGTDQYDIYLMHYSGKPLIKLTDDRFRYHQGPVFVDTTPPPPPPPVQE